MFDKGIDYSHLESNVLRRTLNIDEIYTIFDHTLNDKYTTYGERHNFWEYVYVNKGKLYVDTSDTIIELNSGELILHRPDDYHRHFVLNNSANIYIVSFSCNSSDLNDVSGKPIKVSQLTKNLARIIVDMTSRVFEKYEPYIGLFKRDKSNIIDEQLLKNSIESVLLSIISNLKSTKVLFSPEGSFDNKHIQLVENVTEYLYEHIYENVTMREICSKFYVSKTSLSNKFKDATSRSVIDFFNHIKVIKSMELLMGDGMSIGNVANKLNYSSSQYFSKMFKLHIGVSPREFTKKYNKETRGVKESLF